MDNRIIKENMLEAFICRLQEEEKSKATIRKYICDVKKFIEFAENRNIDKKLVLDYKEHLAKLYASVSANSMIAALNKFLHFAEWEDCCVRFLKVQRKSYCSEKEELTKEEYKRLVKTAEKEKNKRLSLILQTICGTGIRVGELEYITVESLKKGEAHVRSKGKDRVVFIVEELRKKLTKYVSEKGIREGAVFVTRNGKPLSRSNIWREMKNICKAAGVSPEKVFPHNLRHLFARVFYAIEKDIAKLADILGHSSINTTRIYIMTTGVEHKRKMEQMKLII